VQGARGATEYAGRLAPCTLCARVPLALQCACPTGDSPRAETVGKPEVTVEERTRELPPFRVILHNDDVNTFEHVVASIRKLTPLSREEAEQRTWEAHRQGRALLLVTHKERAELYCEQFASRKLTVTCEPDT